MTDKFYETRRRRVYFLLLGYTSLFPAAAGCGGLPTAVPIPGKPFVSWDIAISASA